MHGRSHHEVEPTGVEFSSDVVVEGLNQCLACIEQCLGQVWADKMQVRATGCALTRNMDQMRPLLQPLLHGLTIVSFAVEIHGDEWRAQNHADVVATATTKDAQQIFTRQMLRTMVPPTFVARLLATRCGITLVRRVKIMYRPAQFLPVEQRGLRPIPFIDFCWNHPWQVSIGLSNGIRTGHACGVDTI